MVRVIFLTKTPHDISAAQKFGEFVFLMERCPSPFRSDELISIVGARLLELDYDPGVDFIAMTGPPIQLAMFFAHVSTDYEGPFKILLYDASLGQYKSRIFKPLLEASTEES